MLLRSSPPSPFGRKVKIAAACLGLLDQITVELADPNDPKDILRQQNPLGKIPALIEGDQTFYDSKVILEYLDHKAGGNKIIPTASSKRFTILTDAALMDGIMDAAILVVYESRMRPEDKYVASCVEYQRDKIIRGLKSIARDYKSYDNGSMPTIADIGLACLIDYLDFRKQVNWRDYAPGLEAWMTSFAGNVPGYKDTLPPGVESAPWR